MHKFFAPFFVLLFFTMPAMSQSDTAALLRPVELQLQAYNSRDIDLFASAFSDTVKVYRQPGVLTYQVRDELHKRYGAMFAGTPDLHCQLVNRIVAGQIVIDHEMVQRKKGEPRTPAIAVYRIKDGLIVEVTFIPPHQL